MINSVFAADWVQIGDKIYLDASSLSEYAYDLNFDNSKIYSIWKKGLNDSTDSWKNLEKNYKKKLWYDKTLFVINCSRKELAVKSIVLYDLNENVVDNIDNSYLNWSSIVPETNGEVMYSLVCRPIVSNNIQNTPPNSANGYIQTQTGAKIKIRSHK